MKHVIKCNVCGNNITLESPDDYPGDVTKMLEMVICNRCGDMRNRRDAIFEYVCKKCMVLARNKPSVESQSDIREGLEIVLRKYAQMIAEQLRRPNTIQPALIKDNLDKLMRQPERWEQQMHHFKLAVKTALVLTDEK